MKPQFVYVIYIASTPEKLWQALTDPDFTERYWFGYRVAASGRAGEHMTAHDPEGALMHDDPIIESDPPHRLVYVWRSRAPRFEDEAPSQVTFELEPRGDTVKLTVIHDDLVPGSLMLSAVSDGWPAVLSSLKSLLETGRALPASTNPKRCNEPAEA